MSVLWRSEGRRGDLLAKNFAWERANRAALAPPSQSRQTVGAALAGNLQSTSRTAFR